MPKVSIVMPVYNGETYIREAIDSIIAQTFTDWEFIIVNEYGSNETVTNILQDYGNQDRRIYVIQNETRLRIAESLNVGLRAATGEYIARMDADDIAGKERLAIQVAFMDQHPKIDICGLKVDMFGESTWEWNVYTDPEFLSCACLFYTPFVHPTIMMRTASLRKHQLEYNRDFFYTEDYEFFWRASRVLQFTNLEVPGTYFYRYLSTNATNVGGNQGLQLQNEVMAAAFEHWGLQFTKDEIRILSPNTYPYALSVDEAQGLLERLDLLLKEVFLCKALREAFGVYTLFRVLHRRWMDAYESVRWRSEIVEDGQIQRAIDRGFFCREEFYSSRPQIAKETPRVSVVIPTYNSESYIMDTIWSILEQDYEQFEVLIINEKDSEDRTKECIALFEDPRIQVIQNKTRLGLAKSLNLGFQLAKGEYIARADADDVYPKDRLRKQVEFLDANPEIDVCGSWQRHFGKRNYVHRPPASKEEMRADLIFKCEVCHSTVMLRRDKFMALDVIYDDRYLSEDYELWSRVANKMWFATIPEILGEYRWNGENITAKKMDLLDIEAQKLVQRNLEQAIGIEIPNEDLILLSGWKNPFTDENLDRENLRQREAVLLDHIEEQNKKVKAIDEKIFSKVLDERRVWAGIQKESVVNRVSRAIEKKDSGGLLKKMLKKLLKPLYRPFRIRYENRLIGIQDSIWRQDGVLEDALQNLHDVDGHLYDYYHDLDVKIQHQSAQIETLQQTFLTVGEAIAQSRKQQQTIEKMLQGLIMTVGLLEQQLKSELEKQTALTQQMLLDQIKIFIEESEKNILQVTDTRIWKAEKLINETTDARIWKAEQLINETTDTRVWKTEQLINETTDARIWKMELQIKRNISDDVRFYNSLYSAQNSLKKRIFLIGTSEHPNIGDAAIDVGELKFIQEFFPDNVVVELTDRNFDRYYDEMAYYVRTDDLIFLHGGGNIGERYLQHQSIRHRVIRDFPENHIIILPQTISFDETEEGKCELEHTRQTYSSHKDLTLFTRGMQSLAFAREYFPNVHSECMLDSALLISAKFNLQRGGILVCLRDIDDESGLCSQQYEQVLGIVKKYDEQYTKTNNIYKGEYDSSIYSEIRASVVYTELERFASHKVVVTDRLHGLIFAVITKTPCVLLRSYNQKIPEFYDLLQDSNAIFYVEHQLDEISGAIYKAMQVEHAVYPTVNRAAFTSMYKAIVRKY